NIKRGSWIRKSLEPCQAPDVSESFSDVKMIASPLPPISSPQTEEKKLTSDTSEIDPFTNPLISPLHTPQDLLAKFPPLFISYGGREIFKDDIEMFCRRCVNSKNLEKLRTKVMENENNNEEGSEFSVDEMIRAMENDMNETNPDVVIECDKDMVHSYPMLLGVFGKHSKETLTNIAVFLNTRIPTSSLQPILVTKPASPLSDPSNRANTNKNLASLSDNQKSSKSANNGLQTSIGNFLRKKRSPTTSKVEAMENLNLDVVEKKLKTNHNIPVTKLITKQTSTRYSTFPSSRWSGEIILPVVSSSSIFIPYSYPGPDLLNNLSSQKELNHNKRLVYKRSHSENEIIQRPINSAESVQIRSWLLKQNNISLTDSTKINIWSHTNARGDRMPNSRISPAFRPISVIEE
ncbi:6116_t:CDS:2, partial [Acaulospora morrowiae]